MTNWKHCFASLTSELFSTAYDKPSAAWIVASIFQMIAAFRLSVKRRIWARDGAIFQRYSRWLGKGNKVMSNVSHVVFHSIRQTLAHTNDIEINWCNDKNSCLATVRGENPPLQFQALHLAWHVMWSLLSLRKTNPFFSLFYIQVNMWGICSYFKRQKEGKRERERELQGLLVHSPPMLWRADNCSMARRLWLAG